jgi:hypothetical protein
MISDINDIPTNLNTIDHYLEAPTINTKTHTYHARSHIMCIKPLFILLKNNTFMQWLVKNRIYLEENDLSEIILANAGLILFVHPQNSLLPHHHDQGKSIFIGTTAPDFELKIFKAKLGGEEGLFLLVQTAQG